MYGVFDVDVSKAMTDSTSTYESDSVRQRLQTAARYPPRSQSIDLESIVVRYEDRTDRCTITPRECPDSERLTTWLSADIDAFVELEQRR
ncbi:hypothetical protein ATJ93_0568 [Halopiger aswanensis]|uniref:DUF7511 domain-containing protein n=2 Tax=Halopiger aswanensis TaxID=148449 RepID=A0A3R7GKU3_9EURY|nr:hypothetical protein ATJ93_0568 [Halopiger aswanensis]